MNYKQIHFLIRHKKCKHLSPTKVQKTLQKRGKLHHNVSDFIFLSLEKIIKTCLKDGIRFIKTSLFVGYTATWFMSLKYLASYLHYRRFIGLDTECGNQRGKLLDIYHNFSVLSMRQK